MKLIGENRKTQYERNKEWRQKYPKRRAVQRNRYYAKHGSHKARARSRAEWAIWELDLITAPDRRRDVELALLLERSVRAIQIKRARLKVKVGGEEPNA